jgi:hypothetical protein
MVLRFLKIVVQSSQPFSNSSVFVFPALRKPVPAPHRGPVQLIAFQCFGEGKDLSPRGAGLSAVGKNAKGSSNEFPRTNIYGLHDPERHRLRGQTYRSR